MTPLPMKRKMPTAEPHFETRPFALQGIISEATWAEIVKIEKAFEAHSQRGIEVENFETMMEGTANALIEDIDAADGKADGLISKSEIHRKLNRLRQHNTSPELADAVSYLALLADKLPTVKGTDDSVPSEQLQKMFKEFDAAETKVLFDTYDVNKDGIITREEINSQAMPVAPRAKAPVLGK